MSSNSITTVQHSELTRLQGMQSVGSEQAPRQQASKPLQQVAHSTALQRQSTAADGQDLPLTRAGQAEEQTPVAEVESAVSQISDFVQNFQRDLQFSIDKESDRLVVKVVDSETQEVIRQIPSEETLRIARNLDSADSLILREQA
jgi:flagellar protein FlaG